MTANTAAAFWALVKRDAPVMEQVALAAKQAAPLDALVEVAAGAGFVLSRLELRRSLEGELAEAQLDNVSGGTQTELVVGSLIEERVRCVSAPSEWFAERK